MKREPITLERLKRAQNLIARLIVRDGPVYAPYLDRLDREIEAMTAKTDVVARARRIIEDQTAAGGTNAML
ncbi:hypothetical protein AFEL58S_02082 [Afipia felis]